MNRRRGNDERRARVNFQIVTLIAIVAVILIFIGDYGIFRYLSLRHERTATIRQIESLHQTIDTLDAEKKRLEYDDAYIEQIAREKYRMAKKGEEIYRVIDEDKNKQQ